MMDSALSYLERSVAIMIKSSMSRLYGTKETLDELHKITLELQKLPENSKESIAMSKQCNSIIKESCKLWEANCSQDEDWVWHCRQILPRKRDPQKEWKDLSEDLNSWKLDIGLKLIKRAEYQSCVNCRIACCTAKCRCAVRSKVALFNSEYVLFKTEGSKGYNLGTLAEKATNVRNFYAHSPTYKDVIEHIEEHFEIIEQFASELVRWIKYEDGNSQYVTSCQQDLLNIQGRHRGYRANHMAKWDNVLDGLKNLNFNDFGYILVSTPCTRSANVAVSVEELAHLSSIPWAAIVDFDISSGEDGLLHSLCELEEQGLYRLKVSCQSSSKNMVAPFPYVDIDGAGKGELCRDGHIPWIFPHGQIQNQTNKACPFNDYNQYYLEVHKPLIDATTIIANHLNENSSQGAVSVVLFYGSYACESEKLPYKNFLSDLRHLCNDLKMAGGHVVILSDSLFLVEYMQPLPVLVFPLDIFCKMVRDKLAFGQNELPPVNMPSSVGLLPITFDEEDFELVHEHIDKHEFFRFEAQRKIELQQHVEDEEQTLSEFGSIQDELREKFYKGQKVTWISLSADHAITRREEREITVKLRKMLLDRVSEKVEPAKFVMYHSVGAGATTLARKILWNLRTEYPCVILKSNYKGTERKVKCTSDALRCLYEELRCPILMLIDEEPSFKTVPRLTSSVQANGIPVVFFQVQRYDPSELPSAAEVSGLKDSYSLPNTLHKSDADNLMLKFYSAFRSKRPGISADHCIAKAESSLVTPKEKDPVTDFQKSGIINEVNYVRTALASYYLVKVVWEDNTKESCSIGSSNNEYRMVYLKIEIKTEISRLYQTFHFYGIMYLDEDFRKPMYEHIASCLDRMHSKNQGEDETFKLKLLVLAYLSILFTFKVCESIHIKAFKHLCYAVTRTSKTVMYKLEKFIPEAAKEFVIITLQGQFRITHPIVAHEIIKYYSSISSDSVPFPASFICAFLNYMLAEHNEDAILAVNRLLRYREYTSSDNGSGYPMKKPFSELILTLDKQNPQDVLDVLEYASELISNCHAYGHYARYLSKKMQQYDKALKILKHAENLTSQCFEEGIVLNIKGDIYRERLDQYLKQPENLDWKDVDNNMAYELHFSACEAYQESYKKHNDDFPLFNELVVRMNLLEAIKKSLKSSEHRFLEFVHCIPDPEVAKSIDTCMQLLKELNEYWSWAKPCTGEEDRDLSICSEEARVKTLEIRLLGILGSSKEKQKGIMHDLMTKCSGANVNLPYIRRSYIHLCHLNSNPLPPDLDTCLNVLEKNFEVVGHVDKDMKNWLLIVRNMPDIGGNLETIEKKLFLWKENGPSLITDKRNIRATNDPVWVNFYLTICYFMQLTETGKIKVPLVVNKFTETCNLLKQKSVNHKSRSRITEWLHCCGTGFGRLRSGQLIHCEMMRIEGGSVGNPSWQQNKGDQGFPYISWKGLRIFFDAKKYFTYRFKQGHPVDFGVGFTLRGPQAIIFESVPSKPSAGSGYKLVKPEVGNPQMPPEASYTIGPMLTYSQVAQSDKTPMQQHKADQHCGEPVKHHKKRKHHKKKS